MLYVTPIGRVLHLRPAVPIHQDKVPHRRETEHALAVLREQLGPQYDREIDIIHRALFNSRRNSDGS
jgi:hypothetical protein